MRIHAQKASHFSLAVLSLRSREVERPLVTYLLAACYVAVASLHMAGGISAWAWAVGRMC